MKFIKYRKAFSMQTKKCYRLNARPVRVAADSGCGLCNERHLSKKVATSRAPAIASQFVDQQYNLFKIIAFNTRF